MRSTALSWMLSFQLANSNMPVSPRKNVMGKRFGMVEPSQDWWKRRSTDVSETKMVVFGDSISDVGRRANAAASFDYPVIGTFPFQTLYTLWDSEETISAYDSYGDFSRSVTNGRSWPVWLNVPTEYNFATSSASASDTFRSRQSCTGYTGEDEEYPTGTLAEQIALYSITHTNDTLGYPHVIMIGGNDFGNALEAIIRYNIGGDNYTDPVDWSSVFDSNGATFEPVIEEVCEALDDAVASLVDMGVTGRILISNMPSVEGNPNAIGGSSFLEDYNSYASGVGNHVESLIQDHDANLRLLDLNTLFAAVVDDPSIFQSLGFEDPGDGLASPCLQLNFTVDSIGEVMNTQSSRPEECRDACSLCNENPCNSCLEGNPSASICDEPATRLFWDDAHPTTQFHYFLGMAINECTQDDPDESVALVGLLCPVDDSSDSSDSSSSV